jgi:hypothetical protein
MASCSTRLTGCDIQVTGCDIRVTGCGIRVTCCDIRVTCCDIRVTCCGIRVTGFGTGLTVSNHYRKGFVDEIGVHRENHRPAASRGQTLSDNVSSKTCHDKESIF